MRNSSLIVSAAVAISAIAGISAASAADLPARTYAKAPAMADPVSNWSGFYVGGNAGYGWGRFNQTSTFACSTTVLCAINLPANVAAVNSAAAGSLSANGFTGGVQAGYNWQAGSAVYGVETDFNALNLRGTRAVPGAFPGGQSFFVGESASTNWLFTLRGRLGWTVAPDVLLYATGGLAVADLHVANAYNDFVPQAGASAVSTTKAGWTIGGGAEWALNRNWSAKVEYLYVDLGSVATTTVIGNAFPDTLSTSANLRANIVRAGINYRFGGPVVARY